MVRKKILTKRRYADDNLEIWHTLNEQGLCLTSIRGDGANVSEHAALVLFRLGDALFGIPSSLVRTIQPLGTYIPSLFTLPLLAGILEQDGHKLPILDLHCLVAGSVSLPNPETDILIIRLYRLDVALLTDEIVNLASTLHQRSRV